MRSIPFCQTLILLLIFSVVGCTSKQAKIEKQREKADAAYAAGNLEEARILYMALMKKGGASSHALRQIGSIWFEEGAPLRALPFLLQSLKSEPDSTDARCKLAESFISLRQIPDARKEAMAVLDRDPTHNRAILIAAATSFSEADWEEVNQRLSHFQPDQSVSYHLVQVSHSRFKGDLAATERAVESALKIAPESIEALLAKANLLLSQGKHTDAGICLKKASELAEVPSRALLGYARYVANSNQIDEAIALVENQQKQARQFIPGWILLGELYSTKKQFDTALSCIDKVTGRDPLNPDALVTRGKIFTDKGEYTKATAEFDRLDRSYPDSPLFKFHLAMAQLNEGDDRKAAITLEKALRLNPNYPEAILALARINIKNRSFQESIFALERLLKARPDILETQFLLAESYYGVGRFDEAGAIFRKQIEKSPESFGSHLMLAQILWRKEKLKEARSHFEKANALAPGNLAVITATINFDLAEKRMDLAESRLPSDLSGRSNSEVAQIHQLQSRIEMARGNLAAAENRLEEVLKMMPESVSTIDTLVNLYLANDKANQATRLLKDYIYRHPSSEHHILTLASIYQSQEDIEAAIAQYQIVLQKSEDHVVALNNLAYLYSHKSDRMDEARVLAERAHRLAPDNPGIKDTLGWILYRQGDFQEALNLLEASGREAPGVFEIQYHLGMARKAMGQFDAAAVALKKSISGSDEFAAKSDARRQLELLTENVSKLTIEELESILRDKPNDIQAWIQIGNLSIENGQYERAKTSFESVLKINPRHAETLKAMAILYFDHFDDSQNSLAFAGKAREAKIQTDPEITRILGLAAFKQGKTSWAFGLMEEAVGTFQDKDPVLLNQLGWAAYRLGRTSEARRWMSRAAQSAKDTSAARDATDFLQLTGSALDDLAEKAAAKLKKDPDFIPALMVKANHLPASGATEIYEQIIDQWPDFPFAQKQLARSYLKDDRFEEANRLALSAYKTLPDDAEIMRCLGVVAFKQSNEAYAIRMLEKSASRVPLDGEALVYLGVSYINEGDKKKGTEFLLRAKTVPELEESLVSLIEDVLENGLDK